jgi:hypothetical protein
MARWSLARTPFFFLGPRPFLEAELAAYIRRQHRRGRRLSEIVDDPYVTNRGDQALRRAVLGSPSLIRALGEDVVGAIRLRGTELELSRLGAGPDRVPDSSGPEVIR